MQAVKRNIRQTKEIPRDDSAIQSAGRLADPDKRPFT